ncbi:MULTISPECIES: hypothetical protein [Luteibacter]|uniref:hypothetical protein n=1 Tax=Luteibacter TaxID=242605 RepID=UPI000561E5E1|nr:MULTISPECIES: hypothetical protein [unclassified Luteibacter]
MKYETNTCYQCSAEATGQEHVPPKCLFPKGKDWNRRLKVPSCELHNNKTSDADDYLKFLLSAIAPKIPIDVRASAARGAVRMALKKSHTLSMYGLSLDGETVVTNGTFPLRDDLLAMSLEKMTRALYFHHHCGRRKLLGKVVACPLFLPIEPLAHPRLAPVVENMRKWATLDFEREPKLGGHPEIFVYQVLERQNFVTVNMEFYGAHRVSAIAPLGPVASLGEWRLTLSSV